MTTTPAILALDFDGVLLNGIREYFQTSWCVYRALWQIESSDPPPEWSERFARLRPVIETGWEMPVLLRAMEQGLKDEQILQEWPQVVAAIAAAEQLDSNQLARAVDGYRDQWIHANLADWLSYHDFYPGVIEQLQRWLAASVPVRIITTKEGRFVAQLLQQAGVAPDALPITGKEAGRPKPETLLSLVDTGSIWFVEDRLKTLRAVQQRPELAAVRLFLADWGYNTEADRQAGSIDPAIALLSLEQFTGSLEAW